MERPSSLTVSVLLLRSGCLIFVGALLLKCPASNLLISLVLWQSNNYLFLLKINFMYTDLIIIRVKKKMYDCLPRTIRKNHK